MDFLYLITKAQITQYEDVAVNIEDARMNNNIKKAQELDLKPFMGQAFYYDFVSKMKFNSDGTVDPATPEIYQDLYSGVEYTDRRGNILYYPGLVPALVYWSMARFTELDAIRYTATGPVMKDHDNATALKQADIIKIVQNQRSIANSHINDVINFLDNERNNYPLWRYNARNTDSRQPGPRIRGVDRTDVRRGYGPNGRIGYGDGFLSGLI